jgi:hypothetical protein
MTAPSPQNEQLPIGPATPPNLPLQTNKCRVSTASGDVWFEFTPQKIKETFLEMVQHHLVNMDVLKFQDIAFSSFLDMSSLNTSDDRALHQSAYSSNLYAVLDQQVEEGLRYAALRRVCGIVLCSPSHEALRGEVGKLLDKDTMEEGLEPVQNYNIHEKV